MKSKVSFSLLLTLIALNGVFAQGTSSSKEINVKPIRSEKVVILTGVRFAYPLAQKWIDLYNESNPEAQIIIEQRGSQDPSQYDLLIEAYHPTPSNHTTREYVNVARYAILPIANSQSAFAKQYGDKGLNEDLIKQIFFHDIFADKENQKEIKTPYTIYTRLQKAGVPVTFASYYGYEQKDIKGKAIAGSDEHLLKAVLRDSLAVSYLPLALIYNPTTQKVVDGLTILPVDLNGNKRINDEEKNYGSLSEVIQKLEGKSPKELKNVPIEHIHISIAKENPNPRAIEFIRWVLENGNESLHEFGYLLPDDTKIDKAKFEQFANGKI
jgi:phosphate transport system substrate-binding protein